VGAQRGDRQQIVATPRKKGGFVPDMSEQYPAIGQRVERDPQGEVRATML
jgi:hypothetical protein